MLTSFHPSAITSSRTSFHVYPSTVSLTPEASDLNSLTQTTNPLSSITLSSLKYMFSPLSTNNYLDTSSIPSDASAFTPSQTSLSLISPTTLSAMSKAAPASSTLSPSSQSSFLSSEISPTTSSSISSSIQSTSPSSPDASSLSILSSLSAEVGTLPDTVDLPTLSLLSTSSSSYLSNSVTMYSSILRSKDISTSQLGNKLSSYTISSSPSQLASNSYPLNSTPSSRFQPTTSMSSSAVPTVKPCYQTVCLNGGTLIGCQCSCVYQWLGDRCESMLNHQYSTHYKQELMVICKRIQFYRSSNIATFIFVDIV